MLSGRQTILVVEDEQSIADTIVYALQTEGFAVQWKTTLGAAREALSSQKFDFIVLDVGLPDGSGFDFCREVRARNGIPVLFLTARNSEVDRIVGLEIGGDDYLAKPFSPRELTARVRAILRRGAGPAVAPAGAPSEWTHDEGRCRIAYRSHPLELTRNEYKLLGVLISHPGRVFTRDQLMEAAWSDPGASLDRTVDAHIKSLRAKLRAIAPDSDPIVTHRGLGYALREPA